MPIILPLDLTTPEIRVLQEFRRLNSETLSADVIKAIKHPAGGGDALVSLIAKGWVHEVDGGYATTPKAKDFLALDPKPMVEETSDAAASAESNPDADGI